MNHRILITLLFVLLAATIGCQSSQDGATDPEPDAPDRTNGGDANPDDSGANLLADQERRKLYIDLDNLTQRWLAVRNEGNSMAEVSLHRTQLGPKVDQNLDELLRQVQSRDNRARQITAARALGFTTRQGEVITVLMPLLSEKDADLVSSILVSLWLMASPDTPVTPLVDLLNDDDIDVRNNDAMALSVILRARQSVGASKIPDSEVKRAAGKLVVLVSNIDEDEFVRAHAASALGAIGDPAAVDILINLLGDGSSAVRTRAAEGLGQLGDEQAIPALIQALQGRRAANETEMIVAALEEIARGQGYPCDITALGFDPENWRIWYMTVR